MSFAHVSTLSIVAVPGPMIIPPLFRRCKFCVSCETTAAPARVARPCCLRASPYTYNAVPLHALLVTQK